MAKQHEKTELATQAPATLALPDYLKDDLAANQGSEDVGQNDLLMPRLGQAQALSPQLKKTNEAYIAGLEVGDFFNTATGEVYGKDVLVIPVKYFRQYIEFNPIDAGGGIVVQYGDVSEVPVEDLKFGPNGEKPKCTEFKNRLCLLVCEGNHTEPIVVSTKSSGLKTMKIWNNKILQASVASIKQLWRLESVTRSNGQQEWEGFKPILAGYTPETVYPIAKDFLASLQGKTITVDTAGLQEEETAEKANVPF
jgi:hypothetical protein